MKCAALLFCVLLVGCVPAAVREAAIHGDESSKRAVELIDQGAATQAEMEAFLRSERELWAALRRACE